MREVIRAYQDARRRRGRRASRATSPSSWATACSPTSAGRGRTRTRPSARSAPGSPSPRPSRGLRRAGGRARSPARVGIATGLVVVGDLIGERGGAGGGGGRRDAEPGGAAAGAGRAGRGGRRRGHAAARWAACSTSRDLGAAALKGFAEPVRGLARRSARARPRAASRPCTPAGLTPLVGREHELGAAARALGAGQGGRGPGRAALGRARHRQVAPGPGAARAARRASRTRRSASSARPTTPDSALHPVIGLLERAAGLAPRRPARAQARQARGAARAGGRGRAARPRRCSPTLLGDPGRRTATRRSTSARSSGRSGPSRRCSTSSPGLAAERPVLAVLRGRALGRPDHARAAGPGGRAGRSACRCWCSSPSGPSSRRPGPGTAHVTALSLGRLGRRQGAAMVERVTGGKALPAEVLEQIVARTDGVPLFVEELTKAVLESGLLAGRGRPLRAGRAAAAARDPGDPAGLADGPARPAGAGQGGGAGRRPASAASSRYELLAAVAPLPATELRATRWRGWSRPSWSSAAARRPRRRYTLQARAGAGRRLREPAQEPAPAAARAGSREALEERFPEVAEAEPELLAHHCAEAGPGREGGRLLAAGRRSRPLARSAMAEAVAQLQQGLETAGRPARRRGAAPAGARAADGPRRAPDRGQGLRGPGSRAGLRAGARAVPAGWATRRGCPRCCSGSGGSTR